MKIMGVVGLAVLLSGCASMGLDGLEHFTEADLSAALADAQAHADQAGVMCWSTLLGVVQHLGNQSAPTIIGAATALQAKRDLMGQGGAESQMRAIRRLVNIGCAALTNDEGYTLLKLGAPIKGVLP